MLESKAQRDVIVVGSHVYGVYIGCGRLPLPGETVEGYGFQSFVLNDGGKGSNQALCASRLGASTTFVGMIGSDSFGEAAMEILSGEGCDVTGVGRHMTLPTGVSVAYVESSGLSMIVTDRGANEAITPDYVKSMSALISNHKWCLVQLEMPLIGAIAALSIAQANGVRSILTPGPLPFLSEGDLYGVDVLIPNQTEAAMLLGLDGIADDNGPILREIISRWGVRNVVLTKSSEGVAALFEGEYYNVPAFTVTARNTIGAGDGFAGALAFALSRSVDFESALRFSSLVAAMSVENPGAPWVSYPQRAEVINRLKSHSLGNIAEQLWG